MFTERKDQSIPRDFAQPNWQLQWESAWERRHLWCSFCWASSRGETRAQRSLRGQISTVLSAHFIITWAFFYCNRSFLPNIPYSTICIEITTKLPYLKTAVWSLHWYFFDSFRLSSAGGKFSLTATPRGTRWKKNPQNIKKAPLQPKWLIRRLVIYGVTIIARPPPIVIKLMNFGAVDSGNACPMLVKHNSKGKTKALPILRRKKTLLTIVTSGDENPIIDLFSGGGGICVPTCTDSNQKYNCDQISSESCSTETKASNNRAHHHARKLPRPPDHHSTEHTCKIQTIFLFPYLRCFLRLMEGKPKICLRGPDWSKITFIAAL